MKILHIITDLCTGGAEMMLYNLLSRMDLSAFETRVISLADIGPIGKKIQSLGVPVRALGMHPGVSNPLDILKLVSWLRQDRPHVIQTWLYHADLVGLVFGKLTGIKNICWNIRCSYIDLTQYRVSTKWTTKLCSLFSNLPQVIITNSREAQKFHITLGYKAKLWKLIPNGFDLNKFKPDEQAKSKLLAELDISLNQSAKKKERENRDKNQDDIFLIGFIARYDPIKDHSAFIEAACLLLKERRNVHFILAGRDVKWENKMLAGKIPAVWRSHFHLLGERNDVENITAALDIASSVSYGEGFSNTIGEAMACCVPCVVTDVGDSARIVGNTGRVVPPKDPEALAGAWKELIYLGEAGRQKLGVAARKRVKDHFELSQIVKQYESFYASLLKEGI